MQISYLQPVKRKKQQHSYYVITAYLEINVKVADLLVNESDLNTLVSKN